MYKLITFSVILLFVLGSCIPNHSLVSITSIQDAIDSASSGDTIHIPAGNYDEYIILNKTLTIIADGVVTMRGWRIYADNVVLDGFVIMNVPSNAGIEAHGNNIEVRNLDISKTRQDGVWWFGDEFWAHNLRIHNILDNPSGDPHVDCFQTWYSVQNTLIENNYCENQRTSGSNQITMIENQGSGTLRHLVFRNNIFVMHDNGLLGDVNSMPWLNNNRKNGQNLIVDVQIYGNTIVNTVGQGDYFVRFSNITDYLVYDNVMYGYRNRVKSTNGSTGTQYNNILHPISDWDGDTSTITPTPITQTVTVTPTITPTPTPVATCVMVV